MAKVGEEDPRPNLGKGQGKGQVRRGAREDRRRARSQEKRKQWHKARAPLGHPGGKGPAWEGRHRRTGTSLGLAAVVMPGVCSSGVGGWLRRVGCSGNQKTHWEDLGGTQETGLHKLSRAVHPEQLSGSLFSTLPPACSCSWREAAGRPVPSITVSPVPSWLTRDRRTSLLQCPLMDRRVRARVCHKLCAYHVGGIVPRPSL